MKKYLAILLACLLFTTALTGCGSKSDSQDSNTSGETPAQAEETETKTPQAPEAAESQPEASAPEKNPAQTEETGADISAYYGTWEIKDYVTSEISAMSADEMEAYRGKTVTYQADSILVDDQDANAGSFTYEISDDTYDYDKLTEDYNANLGEWWNNISEVTKVTVVSDTDFFGSQLFLADENTIWIYYEGAFFFARKPEA